MKKRNAKRNISFCVALQDEFLIKTTAQFLL